MNDIRLLSKLSLRYIRKQKSQVLPFIFIIFLSTLLLSSVFIIKDSYDNYGLHLCEKEFGNWDLKSSSSAFQDEPQLKKNVKVRMYENSLPFFYNSKNDFFKEVTVFDNTLPITLTEGKFPTSNHEILIEKSVSENHKIKIGSSISAHSLENSIHKYKVTGIYEKNVWSPSNIFYTLMNQNSVTDLTTVYADIINTDIIPKLSETKIQLNQELFNLRYGQNNAFNKIYGLFILFVFVCAFFFISNSFRMYMAQRNNELSQFRILGATRYHINILLFIEFFILSGIVFLASLLISIACWFFLIKLGGINISKILRLSIYLDFNFKTENLIKLSLMMLSIFLSSFVIALFKNRKRKGKHLFFRKISLNKSPITINQAITEIYRTGHGLFIIFILIIITCFFQTSKLVVETWIEESNSRISSNYDVSISFDLFNKSNKELDTIITKITKICTESEVSFSFKYGIQSEITLGDEMISNVYTIDQPSYNKLLSQNHLKNDDETALLVDLNDSKKYIEDMQIRILSQWGEEIDTQPLNYALIKEHNKNSSFSLSDGLIVVIPNKMTSDWMNKYPSTYISGNLVMNGESSTEVAKVLDSELPISKNDHLYIIDNYQTRQQFQRDSNAIRIFIYSFNIMSILICLVIIYSLLSQYFAEKTHDMFLYNAIGMTRKQIKHLYVFQTIIFVLIALVFSLIIQLLLSYFINSYLNFNLNLGTLMKDFIIFVPVMFLCTTLITIKCLKNSK